MSRDDKPEQKNEKTEGELKKLSEKLKRCQEEKEEYLQGWQRAKADFINFKKDLEKQQAEFAKFSNAVLISELLLVLDSFELALTENSKNKDHRGFVLIKAQLNDILKKHGLTPIKAVGEKFSPEFHEAVEEVESDKKSGIIVEEIQKGYMLHNKVLRASKVKVAK
jgi:molecular chaperone GrpE